MTLKDEEKEADQRGNSSLNNEYLGFSFCLICPQCGGEANTWEVSMGMMSK